MCAPIGGNEDIRSGAALSALCTVVAFVTFFNESGLIPQLRDSHL